MMFWTWFYDLCMLDPNGHANDTTGEFLTAYVDWWIAGYKKRNNKLIQEYLDCLDNLAGCI